MIHVLFANLLVIIPTLVLYCYWRRFSALHRRFHYRITDLWAAVIGLFPTIISAAKIAEYDIRDHGLAYSIVVVVCVGIFQITGLIAGRLDIDIRTPSSAVTAWASAVSIVTGALCGAVCALFMYALRAYAFD